MEAVAGFSVPAGVVECFFDLRTFLTVSGLTVSVAGVGSLFALVFSAGGAAIKAKLARARTAIARFICCVSPWLRFIQCVSLRLTVPWWA